MDEVPLKDRLNIYLDLAQMQFYAHLLAHFKYEEMELHSGEPPTEPVEPPTPVYTPRTSASRQLNFRARATRQSRQKILEPQSGNACHGMENSNTTASQLVSFSDSSPGYTCMANCDQTDETMLVGESDQATLKDFLSRPLKVAEFTTGVNNTLNDTFYPWFAFLSSPRVANRINNFRAIRGNLHLKFVVNGGPFYYGKVLVSYKPVNGTIDHPVFPLSDFYDTTISNFGNIMTASQRPHLYLDYTSNQGGEMMLPFFHPYNGLALWDALEQEGMGEIWMCGLSQLRHANGGTTPVTISVFAWMEDVHLIGATNSNSDGLTPQSGSDEYASGGPISKPASILKNISSRMVTVPVIGRYARATEMISSAVEGVARLFGFSRPRTLETNKIVVPDMCGNMAGTNAPDYATTLALDCKNEVTIDPRVVGLDGTDELTIDYLAGKESIIAIPTWGSVSAPDSEIYTLPVSPPLWYYKENDSTPNVYMTPACFVSQAFGYWSGIATVRIQVMSSANHKGRLALIWDAFDVNPAPGYEPEYNTVFTRVIDISEERDVSVDIAWGVELPYCYKQTLSPSSKADPTEEWTAVNSNGMFSLRVLNPLTGPSGAATDVAIAVSVSMKKLNVMAPSPPIFEGGWFAPQNGSGDYNVAVEENTKEPGRPEHMESAVEFGSHAIVEDNLDKVFGGETIRSFRPWLHRYCSYQQWSYRATATGLGVQELEYNRPAFPYQRGLHNNYIAVPPVANQASNNHTCLMTYLAPLFSGFRGSIRHKVAATAANPITDHETTHQIIRYGPGSAYGLGDPNDFRGGLGYGPKAASAGEAGLSKQPITQQPFVTAELPYYSAERFQTTQAVVSFDHETFQYSINAVDVASPSGSTYITTFYAAAGEDFNFHFFTGVPVYNLTPG